MKRILLFAVLLIYLVYIPIADAELRRIKNIDMVLEWNIKCNDDDFLVNITIYPEDPYDKDEDIYNIENNDNLEDIKYFEIDIIRDIEFIGEDIAKLTEELIITNREVIVSCKDSTNLSGILKKEFIDCIDGRARTAEIHKRCREDKDIYKNESGEWKRKYDTEFIANNDKSTELVICRGDVTDINTQYNSCSQDLTDQEKKPQTYLMFGIVGGIIGTVMYFKGREPKPPEFAQFPER